MAMGYLRLMIESSSKVVLFIESKIGFIIDLIPPQVKYIKEVDAIELREINANPGIPLYGVPASGSEHFVNTEISQAK